ncbi:mitochondrial fission process protein 1 [Elysia marginata]|uniref:Mitochondrial fission process protein 1 n=1 Tax=Elysia marginata TaxID=1093978 RepID=A0AAV4J1I1_9GAST|nr:mitochondrial fission process protein 1 [Elysia marginata]
MYHNFFAEPPTRYIGYAFAFYEAMKSVLRTSPEKTFYLIGTIFVLLHSLDEALEAKDGPRMAFIFIDTLIFEAIASVAIPVFIGLAAFDVSSHLLIELNIHYQVTRYGPVFLALLGILLVSKPLDEFIQMLMSKTIRPLYL